MKTGLTSFAPENRINASDLDFTRATPVISRAQKFVVPVPEFRGGAEPLVYPADQEHAGQPILGWDHTPVGETGIVFWNGKDHCWQAAADDGTHVIIINQVSERDASALFGRFAELGGPRSIGLSGFRAFFAYASELGLVDTYQSDLKYVRAHMTPVLADALQLEYAGVTMGFVKRDDRDIELAVYIEEPFEFLNTDGVNQAMPDGGVVVKLGESIHAVQPDIFRQTHRLAEGGKPIRHVASDIESARLTEVYSRAS